MLAKLASSDFRTQVGSMSQSGTSSKKTPRSENGDVINVDALFPSPFHSELGDDLISMQNCLLALLSYLHYSTGPYKLIDSPKLKQANSHQIWHQLKSKLNSRIL